MIAEIFMISAIVGIFWKAAKDHTADSQTDKPEPENDFPELSESDTEFCFEDVQRRVSCLNQTVNQLEILERLLTDAEITAPEQHETALQMSWVTKQLRYITKSHVLKSFRQRSIVFHPSRSEWMKRCWML